MEFLQFFVWGCWLTSLGVYLGNELKFNGNEIAGIFSNMGFAAILMPALLGILADRWINAERLLGFCHLAGGILLFSLTTLSGYSDFFLLMLLYTMLYMPTLGLANTIAFNSLKSAGMDVVKDFPPIRVWGTVGFILAMWLVDVFGWTATSYQLILAASFSILYGLYAFFLPKAPPMKLSKKTSLMAFTGIEAFSLFRQKKMAVFFIFSMLLGAALQITNTFGQPFLSDFTSNPVYKDSFTVTHPGILTSISQISEAFFILAIPFFLKRYGIKTVMLLSITAWMLRFAFFGIGNPGTGFIFLVLSMIVYGMAFDFFNVSGSLFVEQEAPSSIRAGVQGIFILMTNGIGTIIGTTASGLVVDYFTGTDGIKNWTHIWFTFAGYALVLGVLFLFLFKKETQPNTRTKP